MFFGKDTIFFSFYCLSIKSFQQKLVDCWLRCPRIALKTLSPSSVDILIRVWTKRSSYWDVYYNINEQIYKIFAANGINIPFPQMTVHLSDDSKNN